MAREVNMCSRRLTKSEQKALKVREIPGYPYYYASKVGDIWSTKMNEVRRMALTPCPQGYLKIGLYIGSERHTLLVHRLVLSAWVGDSKPDKPECNHKNGVKTDNRLENLEWCSVSENQTHAVMTGLSKANKKTPDTVREIRRKFHNGDISRHELAEEYEIHYDTVCKLLVGDRWKVVGGPRAESRKNAKLSDEDKAVIVKLYKTGDYTQKQLSQRFGCSTSTVGLEVSRDRRASDKLARLSTHN